MFITDRLVNKLQAGCFLEASERYRARWVNIPTKGQENELDTWTNLPDPKALSHRRFNVFEKIIKEIILFNNHIL